VTGDLWRLGENSSTSTTLRDSVQKYLLVITVSTRLPKIFEERTTAQVLSGHDLCSCAFCTCRTPYCPWLESMHIAWGWRRYTGQSLGNHGPTVGTTKWRTFSVILSCSYSSTRERDQLHGMAFYGMNDCRWLEKRRLWASRQLLLRGPAIYKGTSVPLHILQILRRWPAGFEQAIQFDENMTVMGLPLSLCTTTLLSCLWKPWKKDSTESRSATGPKDKKSPRYVTTAVSRWVSHNGDRSLCDD